MRKGAKIGLGITILFVSVIVGIAAIPDEVLEQSAAKKVQIPSVAAQDYITVTVPKAPEIAEPQITEVSAPEAPEIAEPEEPVITEPEEPVITEPENSETTENQPDESKGNVIRVEIRDGVGTSLR